MTDHAQPGEPSYFDFLMRPSSGRHLTDYLEEIELRDQTKLTPDRAMKAWEAYRSGVPAEDFAKPI